MTVIQTDDRTPLRLQSKSLILEQLRDELMIYDPERHKAFCLNQTAALVWNHADGKTSVEEIAKRLGPQPDTSAKDNEEIVWFALQVLGKDGLLDSAAFLPAAPLGLTRRKMLQQLGVGAMALPVVTALFVSPLKAHASTASSSIPPSSGLPSAVTSTASHHHGGGFWQWLEKLF